MLCVISLFISLQKIRRGPARSRKLWPKNAHADTLPAVRKSFKLELWTPGQFLPQIRSNRSKIQIYYVTYLKKLKFIKLPHSILWLNVWIFVPMMSKQKDKMRNDRFGHISSLRLRVTTTLKKSLEFFDQNLIKIHTKIFNFSTLRSRGQWKGGMECCDWKYGIVMSEKRMFV